MITPPEITGGDFCVCDHMQLCSDRIRCLGYGDLSAVNKKNEEAVYAGKCAES
ncbi:MAG: hypothetical protein ACI4E1_00255 [Lachnospira sp.]